MSQIWFRLRLPSKASSISCTRTAIRMGLFLSAFVLSALLLFFAAGFNAGTLWFLCADFGLLWYSRSHHLVDESSFPTPSHLDLRQAQLLVPSLRRGSVRAKPTTEPPYSLNNPGKSSARTKKISFSSPVCIQSLAQDLAQGTHSK